MTVSTYQSGFLGRLCAGALDCGLSGRRIIVSASGGADSAAMLRGLLELRDELHVELKVAHFNHNLRGEESESDADWLAELCKRLAVPLVIGVAENSSPATPSRAGIEESARLARYEFLESTASALGCSLVAVAHTADDQVETILHHIVRGTGIDGLCGMPRSRSLSTNITLVRPLLAISRAQVLEYLASLGQDFRCDAMNADERFTRSRIRHSLLPLLRRDFNPQVDDALLRLSRQADDVREALESLADSLLAASLEDRQPDVCRLNCEPLAGLPRHLVRVCLARLWKEQDWPRQRMGFAEWDRLAEIALAGGSATLPEHIEARRRGKLLILRRQ